MIEIATPVKTAFVLSPGSLIALPFEYESTCKRLSVLYIAVEF
jgi:hypothetical protein